MSNKAVYIGFLNSTNLGDLEIVNQQLLQLSNIYDNVDIYSWDFDSKVLVSNIDVEKKKSINLKAKVHNIYQKYFRKLMLFDYLHSLKIKSNYRNKIKNYDFIQSVKQCDIIFIGGGNVFFDITTYSPSYYKLKLVNELAAKYNKEIYILQAGIGPFKTKPQIENIIKELKKVKYISVRDIKSKKLLNQQKINPVLSVDPVFSLNSQKKSYYQKNCVGISLMDLSFNKMKQDVILKYEKLILEIIYMLEKNGKSIILFSSEPKDYTFINELVTKENLNVEVIYISNRNQLIDIFNKIDFTIATRMHSMIFSISQNTAVLGISWQDKIEGMYKTLGIENYYLDINKLELHRKLFFNNIEQFINGKYYDVNSVKKYAEDKVLNEFQLISRKINEK
ncbi:hypothetical protein GTN31_04250 [Macrococcoides canis]|uniref:polysaccharide pyruvyl transferase family protein n=1 Tax=Macrococcoides canis TaxID=1855823 RepID=UPI0013E96F85|nr:polysaccharide pyruvyl transferase family protein [Macrococcus canis]QIH75557.1 hypothetical protein GTN31_04250 [Macrococcus canis]